jgi:hypothetical protein
VDGVADRVDEPGVAVRPEIDHLTCLRRQRACDLDVEQDLAVGVLARLVRGTVDADRGHRRSRDPEPGEVLIQVRLPEPAAEFDDRDDLAVAVGAGRKAVDLAELDRGVAGGSGARGRGPELRSRLRAVIEAEDGDDDAVECGRDAEPTGAVAVLDEAPVGCAALHPFELDAESELHVPGRSRDPDPTRGEVAEHDPQPQGRGRARDRSQVGRIRGRRTRRVDGRPASEQQRCLDDRVRIDGSREPCLRRRCALAAGQRA